MDLLLLRPRDSSQGTSFTRIRTLTLPSVAAEFAGLARVRIVDESVQPLPEVRFDLVGITCDTTHSPRAYRLADRYRARGTPVILGGTHPTAVPDEALEHADAVVLGEVEGLGRHIVDDLGAGELRRRYQAEHPPDLASVPIAPVDLLPTYRAAFRPYPFELSRGCRNGCRFCFNRYIHGTGFRVRDLDPLVDAIRHRPEGMLLAMDDNLMNDPELLGEFAERIAPLGRVWGGQSTLEIADDPALLRVLSDSGFGWTFVGLESFSTASLRREGKGFNRVERYRDQVSRLRRAGIVPFAGVIVGLDGDGPGVFAHTEAALRRVAPAAVAFTVPVAYPGTRFHRQMEDEGRILGRDLERYDGHHVVLRPLGMGVDELERGYHRLARSFYGWGPALGRLARQLRARPTLGRTRTSVSYVAITRGYRQFHTRLAAEG